MIQVKMICLAIVRTIILERRPVTTVAKAMDVVLDSYSRLMKMGGGLPGVRQIHEQSQRLGGQLVEDSHVISQGTSPGPTVSPVNPDQAGGIANRSAQANSGVDHGIDRATLNTSSDSDEITNVSGVTSQVTSGYQTSDAINKRQQVVGEDSRPLSSGTTMQYGQHAGSVAISPIEMFQSVFALVEDEMMGDPAYLTAVIMEFLRRYFLLVLY